MDFSISDAIELLGVCVTGLGIFAAAALPIYLRTREKSELAIRIQKGLIQEIVINFKSIFEDGLMEVEPDTTFFSLFKANIHLRELECIVKHSESLSRFYNLLHLYEITWQKERSNYSYFVYEVKVRIYVQLLQLVNTLDISDRGIDSLLSQLLIAIAKPATLPNYIDKVENIEPIKSFIQKEGRAYFNIFSSKLKYIQTYAEPTAVAQYFDEYLTNKYKLDSSSLRSLLVSTFK